VVNGDDEKEGAKLTASAILSEKALKYLFKSALLFLSSCSLCSSSSSW